MRYLKILRDHLFELHIFENHPLKILAETTTSYVVQLPHVYGNVGLQLLDNNYSEYSNQPDLKWEVKKEDCIGCIIYFLSKRRIKLVCPDCK
jgi:hypothetical protein